MNVQATLQYLRPLSPRSIASQFQGFYELNHTFTLFWLERVSPSRQGVDCLVKSVLHTENILRVQDKFYVRQSTEGPEMYSTYRSILFGAGLCLLSTGQVFAFSTNVSQYITVGKKIVSGVDACKVQQTINVGAKEAVLKLLILEEGARTFDSRYPGDAFFGIGGSTAAVGDGDKITADRIAYCLDTTTDNIVNLQTNGADGTFAEDDYIGFTFTLKNAAGGLSAGAHEYKIGSGSMPSSEASTENSQASNAKTAIVADAQRSTVSLVSSNRRMTQEARGRFISNLRQTSDSFVGRNNVAFGMEGDARASNGQLSTKGSFFQQQGNDEGTYRRLFYGDFDVQKDKGTGSTTATLSGKLAWERMISENTMVGYFVGLDLGRSDIDGTFRGDQKSGGLQFGTYAVTELDKNIYLDGFLTVGAAKNKLDMTDGTLALDGTYISRMASFGGALTGVIEQDGYELWPELALTIGHTRVGVLDLNSRTAGVVGNTVAVDAGNVTIANLTLRPEVRMAADGRAMKDSRTLATFAPRVICESVKTTATNKDCGFGSEVGFSTRSETGMTIFDAKVILDKVGSSARHALQLKLEHRF